MPDIAFTDAPNYFAQFDHLRYGNDANAQTASPTSAPDQPKAENFFAQFDHLRDNPPASRSAPSPTIGSILRQLPTGFNEGVADIIGAPVDAMTQGLNNDIRDINKVARYVGITKDDADLINEIHHPFGGSETVKHAMQAVGVPNPDDLPAQNTAERIARGTGGGVAGMMAPELAGSSGARIAPAAGEVLGTIFGRSRSASDLASSAAIGGTAGASGQTAAELAPDKYKPAASVVGSVLGGGTAALGTQLPRAIAEGARSVRDYASPLTETGQRATAGKILRDRASSPADVLETLENGPHELVPGSTPTTFQATGDMGLGALEREVQTRNPGDFQQRRAEQNAARVDALQGVQPVGKPEDLSAFLRTRLAEIDKTGNDAIESATRGAQSETANIGGHQSPDYYGAQIQGQIAPRQAQLAQEAQGAVRRLGGDGTPEGYGASLRGTLQAAENTAREQEGRLWDAIDPDGTMTFNSQPFKQAANRVYGNLTEAAKIGVQPAEKAMLQVVNSWPALPPFGELKDLRSAVSADMRAELKANGRSPTYGRLATFRGAIEDAISSAVEQRAASEAEAVARGEMNPEATISAAIRRQINEWRSAKAEATGTGDPGGIAPTSSGGARTFYGSGGAAGQSGRRSADAPGNPGLSGDAPNFDAAARERLNAASQATRERAQTFNQGPVGQVLRSVGERGNYRVPDAAVPQDIFKPGPGGFQTVSAFRNAVGNDTDAVSALRNYAAASLRRAAERPDGTLEPAKWAAWWSKHQDAMRAIPEVRQDFASAARASEAMHAFTPFRPDLAPSTIPEQFFHAGPAGYEAVNQLRSLIGDQHAVPILSDFAASQVRKAAMRPDGVLDPARFARWQAAHSDALRALPGLADRFATAAKATDAIEQAAIARRQALDDFQAGAIGKLLGHTEPSDTTREVGAIFGRRDAAAAMKGLVNVASQNPGAVDGLRKAVVDYMYGRFIGNTEAATSGQNLIKPDAFQTFVKTNEHVLEALFSPTEVNVMRIIGADLKRSNRSLAAVRIPGQSNTAQDTIKLLEDGKSPKGFSMLSKLVAAAGAGYGTYGKVGAVTGALSVLGQSAISGARETGLAKIDDLVKQALLDPKLAEALMRKAPERPNTGSGLKLAQQLRRLSAYELSNAEGQQQ